MYLLGVDLAFEQLLDNIFGADFMNHFKTRVPASYIDLVGFVKVYKKEDFLYNKSLFRWWLLRLGSDTPVHIAALLSISLYLSR